MACSIRARKCSLLQSEDRRYMNKKLVAAFSSKETDKKNISNQSEYRGYNDRHLSKVFNSQFLRINREGQFLCVKYLVNRLKITICTKN